MATEKGAMGGGVGDGMTEEPKNLQEQWLDMLLKDNLEDFKQLLNSGSIVPNYKYCRKKQKIFGTCLEIASGMPGRGRFVSALLQKVKPTINIIVPEPIHHAARTGADDVMSALLLDKRVDVNAVNQHGETPLHFLAKHYKPTKKYETCLKLLLNHPDIDINKANKGGYTIIHQAASCGHLAMVETILNKFRYCLDLDTHSGHGRTARTYLKQTYPKLVPTFPPNRNKLSTAYNKQLLEAFHNGDIQLFQTLLHQTDEEGNAVFDVNYRYGQPPNETILDMACREVQQKAFIEVLLKAGANPNRLNPDSKLTPILIAAKNLNVEALEVLANDGTINISVMDYRGWSAVHFAAYTSQSRVLQQQSQNDQQSTEARKELEEKFRNCITPLLKRITVDVNDVIKKTNLDDLALQKILKEVYSETNKLSVNDGTQSKSTERKTQQTLTKEEKMHQKLLCYLQNNLAGDFIHQFKTCPKSTYESKLPAYMQVAIENSMSDVVKELLKCDEMDPNTELNDKLTPLILAVKLNKVEIIQMLLDTSRTDVNKTDIKRDTALHHAVRKQHYHIIPMLLNHGADVNHKNSLEKTAFSPTTLGLLLDENLKTKEYPKDENFGVIFDYSFLTASKIEYRQHSQQHTVNMSQPPSQQNTQNSPLLNQKEPVGLKAESEILYFLSNNYQDYSHLFYHPIVKSFLQFKWDCVKHIFYFNILFYLFFFFTLNFYIMYNPGSNVNPTTNGNESSSSSHFSCYFIDHSSNDTNFTDYSVENSTYNFNGTMCYLVDRSEKNITTSELLIHHKLVDCSEIFKHCYSVNSSNLDVKDVNLTFNNSDTMSQSWLVFFTVFLILREGLQIIILRLNYLCNSENYLDLAIVIITVILLLLPRSNDYLPVCFVFAILLSSFEFILLLGRVPIFSRNIEMLKTVVKSYMSLLLVFSLIILAFTHCLYIVFLKDMQKNDIPVVLWAICRTVVFMTGEYEANALDFSTMPVTSIFVFLLFVFFVSIVLLNLLIALSVNDTKMIEKKSEIVCITSRINLIYDIETSMLGLHRIFLPQRMTWLDRLTESVMCFPDVKKDQKTVIALLNQDGKLENNPIDDSAIRKFIYCSFRAIKSMLSYFCCCFCLCLNDSCKKHFSNDRPKMDKIILNKAMKMTGVKMTNGKDKAQEVKHKLMKLLQSFDDE